MALQLQEHTVDVAPFASPNGRVIAKNHSYHPQLVLIILTHIPMDHTWIGGKFWFYMVFPCLFISLFGYHSSISP